MKRNQLRFAASSRQLICCCMAICWMMAATLCWNTVLKVPQDYPSIANAITAAREGDEIWVKQGTYAESLQIPTKAVGIYGGFAGTETQREQRDPAVHLTTLQPGADKNAATITADGVIIDGFDVTNANTAIYFDGTRSAVVSNCRIRNSKAGAEIYNSSPAFRSCKISMTPTFMRIGGGCALQADYCLFLDDGSESDKFWVAEANLSFTGCAFIDPSNYHMQGLFNFLEGYWGKHPSLRIRGCTFRGWGVVICVTTPGFTLDCANSIFADFAYNAVYFDTVSPKVDLTTVALRNNVFYGNGVDLVGFAASYGESRSYDHAAINTSFTGSSNNIGGDPKFANAAQGDLHLLNGSSALDRALLAEVPSFDLDGVSRPGADGLADIGAYEADPSFLPPTESTKPTSSVNPLPPYIFGTTVTIGFRANDNESAIAAVDIYYRKDGGSWSHAPAMGGEGKYDFYTIATDHAGNIEDQPSSPDASTSLIPSFNGERVYVAPTASEPAVNGRSWALRPCPNWMPLLPPPRHMAQRRYG